MNLRAGVAIVTVSGASMLALAASETASAHASDLPACSSSARATVNPKDAPTAININGHKSVGVQYVIAQCDPGSRNTQVRIEGLDDPSAVTGSFESVGDGVGFLHLVFKRGGLGAGSTDIRVVIGSNFVHTSVLTLTLNKRSPSWTVWLFALAGCIGGLLLFGLRSLETNAGLWRIWKWNAFTGVAGLLAVIAGIGAALGTIFAGLPAAWTASTGWWPFFLKVGTATIGAATALAIATGQQTRANSKKPAVNQTPEPGEIGLVEGGS